MAKLSAASSFSRLLSPALAVAVIGLVGILLESARPAVAQVPSVGLLLPGNAAVTGFSGAIRPTTVPADDSNALIAKTRINPNGPALRIIDLQSIGGKLTGQYVNEPKPFTFNASVIGQVFAVALDNAVPPNIYVAATSAYGLPVVVKGSDNLFVHTVKGEPGAVFMPGLWGPAAQGGGPGSIWRIDGVTGAVSLFANVTFNGTANPGPALGGLVYEPDGNTLLTADRWTGLIHRYRMDGSELAVYDHGAAGRPAAGLAPVVVVPAPLDITSPAFNSADASTYGYANPERRVFGLGVHGGRLYYAVAAGLEIWSVALSPDGTFGNDARRDIVVPPGAVTTEISKITFDDQGRMFLAERAAPTGAADFEALTPEGTGRVLRYAIVGGSDSGKPIWQPVPNVYPIGFPRDLRNGNGGVALGYDYDAEGHADRGVCGGFIWSTGEVLRHAADPGLAARLAPSGPLDVTGLQGNWTWLTLPRNVPPLRTVFTDYNGHFDDGDARGHMGDLAIWRVCGPVLRGGWMIPDWVGPDLFAGFGGFSSQPPGGGPSHTPNQPPGGECPANQQKPGYHCCPTGTSPDAAGQCKPYCPNGSTNPQEEFACALGFDTTNASSGALKCIGGSSPVDGKGGLGCLAHSPFLAAPVCAAGYTKQAVAGIGELCVQSKAQLQCPPGQQIALDGQCHALCNGGTAWPVTQCCPINSVMSTTGQCCPPGLSPDPKSGACKQPPPSIVTPPSSSGPPPGQSTGTPPSSTGTPPGQSTGTPPSSTGTPPGQSTGTPPSSTGIPPNQSTGTDGTPGSTAMATLSTCDPSHAYVDAMGQQQCCPQALGPKGQCCPAGYGASGDGACCVTSHLTSSGVCCPSGQIAGGPAKSQCVPSTPSMQSTPPGGQCCARGSIPTASGLCCPAGQATSIGTCCPAGEKADARGTCQKAAAPKPQLTTSMPMIEECETGAIRVNGACCPDSRVSPDGQSCMGTTTMPMIQKPPVATCPNGQLPNARGNCIETTVMPTIQMPLVPTCPNGAIPDAQGNCLVQVLPVCPNGRAPDTRGKCMETPIIQCRPGEALGPQGRCIGETKPNRPMIGRPPQSRPTVNRPVRGNTPNHDNQHGVEPQIKRSISTPPRIVGPKPPKPPTRAVLPPRQLGKRCVSGKCF